MSENPFLTKTTPINILNTGKEYYTDLLTLHFNYYNNQRSLLSSVFNEQNQSTNYAIQLRARALELARLRLFLLDVHRDIHVDTVRSDYLYKNFGYFLQIDDPYFFPGESDEFYRNFIIALQSIVVRGSKKSSILAGISLFTRGLPFSVSEPYLDCVDFKRNYLALKGYVINNNDPSYLDMTRDINNLYPCDKTDTNIFIVKFQMDQRPSGLQLNGIVQGIDYFLDIIKPAHTAYFTKWSFEDTFDLNSNCYIYYDLTMGEKIPSKVSLDPSGIEITSIDRNIFTLSNGDTLFLVNSTVLKDESDADILFSSFSVGQKISHVSVASSGRFKYDSLLENVPAELLYTSFGYIREPLVSEVTAAFTSSNLFQMFVKKQLDEGEKVEIVTKTSGICDVTKRKIYTWHYDDFRKCGAYREFSVSLEDVTSSYDSLTQSIQVSNYPMTKGNGLGELAEITDVSVFVDGTLVEIQSLLPVIGKIILADSTSSTNIKVSYKWSENINLPMIENQEGSLLNNFSFFESGAYTNKFNNNSNNAQRRTNWKLKSYALQASSILNLTYSLSENSVDKYKEKFNHARVVTNYTDKACQIFDTTRRLGLTSTGECLTYPTPPVQLRFNAEAKIPDPWILLAGSDILNDADEKINSLGTTLLNNVFRKLVFGPYDKRYAFLEVEKSECGGDSTYYPFCDAFNIFPKIGLSDNKSFIKPELDYIRFNEDGSLENEDVFYGIDHTGYIFVVRNKFEEVVDPPQEELTFDFNLGFYDSYKNPPLNIIIENDAISDYVDGLPTIPVLGFEEGQDILNTEYLINNEPADFLNSAEALEIGTVENSREILIPPSRVFPGDSLDVVPAELKSSVGDTNYVFHGKQTFDESVLWNFNASLDDEYQYPAERYVLNNYPYGLNTYPFVLNTSNDVLTVI